MILHKICNTGGFFFVCVQFGFGPEFVGLFSVTECVRSTFECGGSLNNVENFVPLTD